MYIKLTHKIQKFRVRCQPGQSTLGLSGEGLAQARPGWATRSLPSRPLAQAPSAVVEVGS